jgi:N-acetylmuramoyl-L-alanine amidase
LKTFDPGQRARRLGTALLLLLLPALPVQARGRSEAWANTQFSNAERLRESLNNLPAKEQSRHEYVRVINAYRRVYYGAPASAKADPSVVAVADLLAEMGRCFNNQNDLRSAIGQYKFLRREYPGSRSRFDALFKIASIYQDDLHQPAQARPIFEEFLRRYPHNHLADAARSALTQPAQQVALNSKPGKADATKADVTRADVTKSRSKVARGSVDPNEDTSNDNGNDIDIDDSNPKKAEAAENDNSEDTTVSRITSIRHWSSQNYTRVAIDLEQDAKFESRRIENPGRIFFDLRNTSLGSNLLGKTFDVDDGLLKKIRVAQFKPGQSRIVLEVADRSDYDTFLLTGPPRLIIDIHSKEIRGKGMQGKDGGNAESLAPASSGLANSGSANNDARKASTRPQGVQTASLKQPVPLITTATTGSSSPKSNGPTDDAVEEEKLPSTAREKTRAPAQAAAATANVSGPKKTVVEADDSDNDTPATVAKLDPPEVVSVPAKSPAKVAKTPAKGKSKIADAFPDVREASPTASGDRSLIRALGLKIGKIVIDPGHGGHDTGTIGPNGLEEKDLVLDVGRRLGKLLQGRLGADVVYTRKDDTFIPLETRTSIANQEQADLFVSIHANSSRDADARGVETYYLNFTSSAEALDVAARENAASDKSIHELQDLVKKIALKEKIEESREFASNVQHALHSGLAAKSPGIRDRGVKKAPFIVLIGANMPSILAEISFVSNPGDERRLRTADYRQRIAESLYRGISKYVSGLSGVKVAAKIDKGEGQ